MSRRAFSGVCGFALAATVSTVVAVAADRSPYVRVSPRDPRYLELSDGQPYVPIGLNLAVSPTGVSLGVSQVGELPDYERWCRDSQNTWQSELAQGQPPQSIEGATVDLAKLTGQALPRSAAAYDPWKDRWTELRMDGSRLPLPAFSRSMVIKVSLDKWSNEERPATETVGWGSLRPTHATFLGLRR